MPARTCPALASEFRNGRPLSPPSGACPADKRFVGRTKLNRISVGDPLGYHSFVERTTPAGIQLPQFPIQLLRLEDRRVVTRYAIKRLRQGRLPPVMLREGSGQECLAFSPKLAHPTRRRQVVEHQECPAA